MCDLKLHRQCHRSCAARVSRGRHATNACRRVTKAAAAAEGADTREGVILRLPAARTADILSQVAEALQVDDNQARQLINLGAVWYGEHIKGQDRVKWRRAASQPEPCNVVITEGQWMKLHPYPKRYPSCHSTDWQQQLVHVDDDYVVVNKPAGLPCMRHESNSREHLQDCAEAALKLGRLQACHRLDQWTTGIVVLGRHKEAVEAFNRALAAGDAVHKTYLVLTTNPVPSGGRLQHYMYDGPFGDGLAVMAGGTLRARGPRLLSSGTEPGWKLCCLDILSCEVGNEQMMAWCQQSFSDMPLPARVFCSRVRLVTGRTHQIRSQFAAIGAPILGDVMYSPLEGQLVEGGVADAGLLSAVACTRQLDSGLGLHAWRMEWQQHVFEAPAPWQSPVL